jgi:hypothetical protein
MKCNFFAPSLSLARFAKNWMMSEIYEKLNCSFIRNAKIALFSRISFMSLFVHVIFWLTNERAVPKKLLYLLNIHLAWHEKGIIMVLCAFSVTVS